MTKDFSTMELCIIEEAILSDLKHYTNMIDEGPIYEREYASHKVKVLSEARELKRYDSVDVVAALDTLHWMYDGDKEMEGMQNVILSAISK